ncbi:MAG: MATE family efflux transporter [Paludibacteraceae bacterium]|nr:MATE family efflux transporter [Paludibacteraceae bacterium]
MNSKNKEILQLALPAIITNITVPLLGLVDTTITGHLGKTAYIGAVSEGATLFNMIYRNFGSLRMGTRGQTPQAYGRNDHEGMANALFRSLFFSALFSVAIWLLQWPITTLAFRLMDTSPDVESNALRYFRICIWGAPAIMGMYSLKGWFIGMQNTRFPMVIAISINTVNILTSLGLVYGLGWKVEGVACGTLIAQYTGLAIGLGLWFWKYRQYWHHLNFDKAMAKSELRGFFKLNGGIFLRTLCLNAVMSFFTFAGAHQGETLLAVNVLLMQLFNLFSYFTDGFAYAGEALVGKYTGAKNKEGIAESIKLIFRWGWGLVAAFTLLYFVGAEPFLHLLTDQEDVRQAASDYYYWVLLVPVCGFAAFLWDGIMVGATAIKPMITATATASVVFFILYFALHAMQGNHALWIAFLSYLATRGLVQARYRL